VSIAIVTLAGAIQWLVMVAMIGVSAAAVAVAERCQTCPSAGLTLLDVGEWCSRVARRMAAGRAAMTERP
jgi:hypothetical protein